MNIVSLNSDSTLSELIKPYVYKTTNLILLNTKDDNGVTNWERIKRKYSKSELDENEQKYASGNFGGLLIKSGTPISLSNESLKRDIPHKTSDVIFKNTEYRPFISSQLAKLLRDPNYTKLIDSYSGEAIATIVNNDLTVLVWCRALTTPGDNSQSGTWLNISPFVSQVSTSVTKDSGSFSLTLTAIPCEFDPLSGWKISSEVSGYDTGDIREEVRSQAHLLEYSQTDITKFSRRNYFFNLTLSENDLVFIKMEKLSIDDESRLKFSTADGKINPATIPGQVFDMIGLVDEVSLSTAPSNVTVNVSGRDLMKVFIEDNSFFFPEQFALNIFTNENSILTKRNRYELEAQSLAGAGYTFKTIQTILKFIFNKYSNMGMVPNSAFNGYGASVNKAKYQLNTSELSKKGSSQVIDLLNSKFLKEERQGVYRIIDLVFDPQIADRVLADNSISMDNGSIINSMRKICQEPFVELSGDTYGDRYYVTVRKPPFDEKGYKGLVYDEIEAESNENENNKSVLATGKLGISKAKLKRSIQKQIEKISKTIGVNRNSHFSDLVIDIEEIEVESEQLTTHSEAYSWYRVIPRGLGPLDDITSFQLAPVVPFDEYAEIWGNKTFSIEYNYAPTQYLEDSNTNTELKYAEAQAFYDLQFCIQSHAYLPFTRRGTIVLSGDRRIKRGLFVYLKSTDEIFYVDAVTHTRSVSNGTNQRSTILQVSRGMRSKFIKGIDVVFPDGVERVSYFTIVNTKISNEASVNNTAFLKNWKVNRNVFNFFLQNRQWS